MTTSAGIAPIEDPLRAAAAQVGCGGGWVWETPARYCVERRFLHSELESATAADGLDRGGGRILQCVRKRRRLPVSLHLPAQRAWVSAFHRRARAGDERGRRARFRAFCRDADRSLRGPRDAGAL